MGYIEETECYQLFYFKIGNLHMNKNKIYSSLFGLCINVSVHDIRHTFEKNSQILVYYSQMDDKFDEFTATNFY